MADNPLKIKDIALSGKLITSVTDIAVSENFKQLKNMRYTEVNPETIGGMSKINTTALTTYLKTRSGFHFKKEDESHVLVQAYNSGETASQVIENTTDIPDVGDFSGTVVHTDTGTGLGRFSNTPTGEMAYCNGNESLIWSGDELTCSGFHVFDPDGTFSYNYTEKIQNSLTTDIANVAVSPSGLDSNVVLLTSLDNNVTDTSPTTPHTVTNNNVTFSASDFVFGTHSAVFNGTNATLTVPSDADFDFSGGTWTVDARVKVDNLSNDNPIYERSHEMDSLAFTSGGMYEIMAGDTIDGQVSNATAIIEHIELTSGTWAGGDAAGNLYFRTADKTGTFQSETINVGASTNVATIAGDSSSAGYDYFIIEVNPSGGVTFLISTVHGSDEVTLSSTSGIISTNTWYHIEVSENGDDYYIFVDGILRGNVSSTVRPAVDTSVVYIGYDASDMNYFTGKMDEYRVSDICRHTSDFVIPQAAYSTINSAYFYIGALRPVKGIDFYIGTANTSTGSMTAQYWDGSAWTPVSSLVDGTSSGGVSLAQTGSVTFSDTEATAKLKYVNQTYIYWYRIAVDNADTTTTIYQVTLDASMQSIKDIWDGSARTCFSFQKYDGGYQDNTINVRSEDYSSFNDATFADISSLTTSTKYLVAGFTEPQSALIMTLVGGKENTTVGTITTISYWDGAQFTSVGNIDDGTLEGGISFSKSGVIAWTPPAEEFKTKISKEFDLYYYKIEFSKTLSSSVNLDFVGGIPAQKDIKGYKFPINSQERLFLCSDQTGEKNSAIVSAFGTSSVFGGSDTTKFYFGDDTELIAGTSIYGQFGSNLYNLVVMCKRNETWLISGTGPNDWRKYRASSRIGCAAPLSMVSAHLTTGVIPTLNRHVAIWQSPEGIYIFDGKTFIPIHKDINDLFDKRETDSINRDKIADSVGFFDEQNQEYHWLFASGTSTTLDKELVYDLKFEKWYEVERNSALQFGLEVEDSSGNIYNYGFLDTGYMYRLENGNTFDGNAITSTLETGDIYVGASPLVESTIRVVKLTTVAKENTTNNITLTHYGDTKTTGSDISISPSNAGASISDPTKTEGWGPYITHRFKLTMTTDDETVGFEPIILSLGYKLIRMNKN